MSGAEVIAVVACVAAVVSAYSDGAKLFDKLKERRDRRRQSNEAMVANLESSLARGQTEVLTHFNAHAARLGKRFEMGDPISREQLKDIIITLQGMLLTNLRASVEHNASLDMMKVLLESDRGRARTISVLHELYERIARETPAIELFQTGPPTINPVSTADYHMRFVEMKGSPRNTAGWPIPSAPRRIPPSGRVLGESLASSPTDITGGFMGMMSEPPPTPPRRRSSGFSTQMSALFGTRSRKSSKSTIGSSHEVTEEAEIDSPGRLAVTLEDYEESMPVPKPRSKPRRKEHRRQNETDEIISDEGNELIINPWTDDVRPDSGVGVESDAESDDSAAYEMAEEGPSTRPEQMLLSSELSGSPRSEPPHSLSSISRSPPAPSILSNNSHTSGTSNNTLAPAVPYSIDNKTYWPPRKANHFSGFCEGASGLRAGESKFKLQYEPFGMYAHTMRWGCPSCFFGMPLAAPVTRRKDAAIDSSVHRHPATGIKYRWMFLAKSHIPKKDGVSKSMGFGCVFCCVELDACAPILHSVDDFMSHLASHRGVDHAGLLGLMNCVTGRVAHNGEDFDVNIPPSD